MADKAPTIREVKASIGDLRMSPRKVRLVTDLIKNKSVQQARIQLSFTVKKAAHPILKLVNSAVASATHNFSLNPDALFVKNITVNQGQMLKRYKPRAQGRALPIRRRNAVVEIILIEDPRLLKNAKKAPVKTTKVPVKVEKEVEEAKEETARQPNMNREKNVTMEQKPLPKPSLRKRLFNRKTNA